MILGLLLERPSHPYELKRRLSPGLPRGRLINDGILYPLLGRLEREGLVEKTEQTAASGRVRHVFHTTEDGRGDFLAWLKDPDIDDDRLTYDFLARHPLVKLLFFDQLSAEEQKRQLEAAVQSVEEAFGFLQDRACDEPASELGQALLEVLAGHWESELRWLRELQAGAGKKGAPASDSGERSQRPAAAH